MCSTILMDEATRKLTAWLSPSFPVGGFAYSHGLETACAEGIVHDQDSARNWIGDVVRSGAGFNDAVLLAHAFRAATDEDEAAFGDLCDLALALAPSAERLLETEQQGKAFGDALAGAWHGNGESAPYPVAVGRAASMAGADIETATTLYLQAFSANLVFAAIRLVPLGQVEGQRILAALHPLIHETSARVQSAPLDQIGGASLAADIASMRHETQDVRLFRS